MNTIRLTLLTLLVCHLSFSAFSQGFTIESTDASAFPGVTIRIQNKTGKALEKSAVRLKEGKAAVTDFSLSIAAAKTVTRGGDEKAVADGEAGAVLFLIENSAFTSAQQVRAAKTAIENVLRSTKNGTTANVCFFNRTRAGGVINRISSEFTTAYPELISDMNQRVGRVAEPSPATDLYKALYESIEFMAGKVNLSGPKQIILIATGKNNGGSPISLRDCIDLAAKSKIIVNGIGLRSADINATDNVKIAAQNMGGRYETGEREADIEQAMKNFTGAGAAAEGKAAAPASGSYYAVTYNSLASPGENVPVELTVGSVTQATSFTVPADAKTVKGRGNNSYFLIIGAVLLVALVAGFLFVQRSRKKKAAAGALQLQQETERRRITNEAEARRREEEDARRVEQQAQPQSTHFPQPAPAGAPQDLQRTVVGGAKLPQLFVTAGGRTQTYNLTGTAMRIGRDDTNEIVIKSPNVSRQHATLGMEGGQWFITDNGSTNGILIGGQRVQKSAITNGRQILLGDAVCTLAI